jgi:Na+-transporting NADH:ubiquinone oxidoreductase subunit NqrD
MSMSSRVLGEVDAVAGGEDCETTSSVAVALRELVDDTELVGVVVVEEVVAAARTAHNPLWHVAPGGQHESPHWSSCVVGSEWS